MLDAHTILMEEKRKIIEKGFDVVTVNKNAERIKRDTNKTSQLKYQVEKGKRALEKEAKDIEADPKKKRKHRKRTKKDPNIDPKIFAEQLKKTLKKKIKPKTKKTQRRQDD